ncbi:MAG: hypothetical protein RLZZ453_1140 [Chlamydiota bacterium]
MPIESWNNEDRPSHPLYDYHWQDADEIPSCLFFLVQALNDSPVIEVPSTMVAPCKAIALMTSLDSLLLCLFNQNAQRYRQDQYWMISTENHVVSSLGLNMTCAAILDPNSTTECLEVVRESYNRVFQELINHWEHAEANTYPDLASQKDPELYSLFIKKKGTSLMQEHLMIQAIAYKLFRPSTIISSNSWRLPSTREDTYFWVKKASISLIKEKMGLKI